MGYYFFGGGVGGEGIDEDEVVLEDPDFFIGDIIIHFLGRVIPVLAIIWIRVKNEMRVRISKKKSTLFSVVASLHRHRR